MDSENLLTIKEFAEITGVSVQSVYKKIGSLNHAIQQFVVELNGVKHLKREAIDWYQNQKQKENNPGTGNTGKGNATSASDQAVIDILRQQIDILNQQIAVKDKQIENLLDQLNKITVLIDQQQKLTAMNQKPLIAEEAEADQEEPKRKRWWNKKSK